MNAELKREVTKPTCVILYHPEDGDVRAHLWFHVGRDKYGAIKKFDQRCRMEPPATIQDAMEWVVGEANRLNVDPWPLQNALYYALKEYLVIGWVRSEAKPRDQEPAVDPELRRAVEELYDDKQFYDLLNFDDPKWKDKIYNQFRRMR